MNQLLWPHKCRGFSYWFIAAGFLLSYFYYRGFRPDFLDIKTFAIASAFLEKKYFVFIQNNLLDEIAFLSLHFGLFIQIFSQPKRNLLKVFIINIDCLIFFRC